MKLVIKLAILMIATLITFIGFNMMASSSYVDILEMGKKAGFEIIANTLPDS